MTTPLNWATLPTLSELTDMAIDDLRALEAQLVEPEEPVMPAEVLAWVRSQVPASQAEAADQMLIATLQTQRRLYEREVRQLRTGKESAERDHPSILGRSEQLMVRALRQNLAVFRLDLYPEEAKERYRAQQPTVEDLAMEPDKVQRFGGTTAQLREALDAWEGALDRIDADLPVLAPGALRARIEQLLAEKFAPSASDIAYESEQGGGGYGNSTLLDYQAVNALRRRHEQRMAPLRAWLNELPDIAPSTPATRIRLPGA